MGRESAGGQSGEPVSVKTAVGDRLAGEALADGVAKVPLMGSWFPI